MKRLYLADLKGKTESEIKAHIADNYAGNVSGFDCGNPTDQEKQQLAETLDKYDILVAYESVGSWGVRLLIVVLVARQTHWRAF